MDLVCQVSATHYLSTFSGGGMLDYTALIFGKGLNIPHHMAGLAAAHTHTQPALELALTPLHTLTTIPRTNFSLEDLVVERWNTTALIFSWNPSRR